MRAAKPPIINGGVGIQSVRSVSRACLTPEASGRNLLKKGKEKSAHDKKRVTRAPTGMLAAEAPQFA